MSFKIDWNFIDPDSLRTQAKAVFKQAMNKGVMPDVIVGDIELAALHLGTKAPRLDILEIGELDLDKFRGIFKLEYDGDAYLSLRTKIEANPLALMQRKQQLDLLSRQKIQHKTVAYDLGRVLPRISLASKSLTLPLSILLCDMKLSAIVIVVYSVARGLTLVFQNDPLQSVRIQSSFDFVPGVAEFIQQEIEERLRESFRDDIPEILYQLSQNNDSFSQILSQVKHEHVADAAIPFTMNPSPTAPTGKGIVDISSDVPDVNFATSSRRSEMFPFGCQDTLRLDIPTISEAVSRATLGVYERQKLHSSSHNASRFVRSHKPRRRILKLGGDSASDKNKTGDLTQVDHASWPEPPPTYKEIRQH